jgi:hypothetical protein
MRRGWRPAQGPAIIVIIKIKTWHAGCNVQVDRPDSMTASLHHHFRRAGARFTQGQSRCAVMRPVVVSVWNKKTGTGNQN